MTGSGHRVGDTACAAQGIASEIQRADARIVSSESSTPWPSAILARAMMLLVLLIGSSAVLAAAAPSIPKPAAKSELQSSLYLGTLLTLDQDQGGALHRGKDLVTLRIVAALPLPIGIRFGGRMDMTSLGAIDPANLDLKSLRTIETYGALSWSRKVAGFDVGPAVAAGALIPVEGAVTWRYEALFSGGARLGRGRSWLYLMAGSDGAADAACACTGGLRFIGAGSIELSRFALIGDFVSGPGGRKRLGALFRLPLP
jgi:hypothetical protein